MHIRSHFRLQQVTSSATGHSNGVVRLWQVTLRDVPRSSTITKPAMPRSSHSTSGADSEHKSDSSPIARSSPAKPDSLTVDAEASSPIGIGSTSAAGSPPPTSAPSGLRMPRVASTAPVRLAESEVTCPWQLVVRQELRGHQVCGAVSMVRTVVDTERETVASLFVLFALAVWAPAKGQVPFASTVHHTLSSQTPVTCVHFARDLNALWTGDAAGHVLRWAAPAGSAPDPSVAVPGSPASASATAVAIECLCAKSRMMGRTRAAGGRRVQPCSQVHMGCTQPVCDNCRLDHVRAAHPIPPNF